MMIWLLAAPATLIVKDYFCFVISIQINICVVKIEEFKILNRAIINVI
jgi:hypothetical protein